MSVFVQGDLDKEGFCMQPAPGQQAAAPDLVNVKLDSEIRKLKSERLLLRRQLRRGDRPTWWEVVKTVVPWVSLAVGALAFATGHAQTLRQERQRLIQEAMGQYLGDHPEIGAFLFRELAVGKEATQGFLAPKPPDVSTYLLQGIELETQDPKKDILNHRRNLAALEVLADVSPPVDLVCKTCVKVEGILGRQLDTDPLVGDAENERQGETVRSIDFLCRCGALLEKIDPAEKSCRREAWDDLQQTPPLYAVDFEGGHCLRHAALVASPAIGGGGS